ncbi:MAG TPA: sigma-70 family RNA polymerase sigma factor [Opitutales bacterium]|nr:sigma-70 family RNA polymerase sigma factor [Opitutales bacterium]
MTTRWTLIGEAADAGNVEAKEALGTIFETYWKPLYRYVRRRGKSPEDAEDLVQGFFVKLLDRDGLKSVDRERGRFRAFLLMALKHYMVSEWQRDHRKKRGGFAPHLSLDREEAETGLSVELEDERSPDRLFDREWALALLDKVLRDMEAEDPAFSKWTPFLSLSRERLAYAEIAEKFAMSEGAARVAVHRLRKRYRKRVRNEIACSLSDASMVEDELNVLFSALAQDPV